MLFVNLLASIALAIDLYVAVFAWETYKYIWDFTPILLAGSIFYDCKYFVYSDICKRFCKKGCYSLMKNAILLISPQTLGAFLFSGILMWKCFCVYTITCSVLPHTVSALLWVVVSMIVCQVVTAIVRLIPFMKKIL